MKKTEEFILCPKCICWLQLTLFLLPLLLHTHFLFHVCKQNCHMLTFFLTDSRTFCSIWKRSPHPAPHLVPLFHLPCFLPSFCSHQAPVNSSQKQDYIVRVTVTNGKEINISKLQLNGIHGEKSKIWKRAKLSRNDVVSSSLYTKNKKKQDTGLQS